MMWAEGIGRGIEGFFRGREIRQGWEDRKDAKKRQEWLDKLYEEGQGREAEAHRARMDAYGREASDWQHARDDQERWRTAVDATFADGGGVGALGATPGPLPSSVTPSSKSPDVDPVASIAADLGLTLGAAPNRAAEQFMRARPVESFQAPVAPAPRTIAPSAQAAPAGAAMAAPAPQPTGQPAPAQPAPVASLGAMPVPPQGEGAAAEPTWEEWLAMSRVQRKAAGLPETRIGGEWAYRNKKHPATPVDPRIAAAEAAIGQQVKEAYSPNQDHQWGQPAGMMSDAREAAKRFTSMGDKLTGQALQLGATAVNTIVNRPVNALARYAVGRDFGEIPTGGAVVKPTQAQQKASPVPLPTAAGPTKAAAKAAADVSGAAIKAASEVAPGPMRAAAAAVPELGAVANSRPAPPEQVERGATAFVSHYRTERVPAIVQELVRQGRLDQAMQFQNWLDQRSTQEGMKLWARAAVAGSMGDWEAFQSNLFGAYNAAGYFDDGVQVVPEKSGFTTYQNGTPRGAKLTLRRPDGSDQVLEFDDIDDFVQQGIMALSPENALAHSMARLDAAKKAALGAAEKDAEHAAKRHEAIRKRAGEIMRDSMGAVTPEQAVQMAIEEDRAIDGAMSLGSTPQMQPPPEKRF